MLFRNRKKTAADIFKKHYDAISKIIKYNSISHNAEAEALPAMYIVADIATASNGGNRRLVAESILSEIRMIFPRFDKITFDKRCVLYGEIIRGKKLRCEWFPMGDASVFYENAIYKCAALLGDILYNPECATNYDNASLMIYGMDETLSFFATVIKPLIAELGKLFDDIYEL